MATESTKSLLDRIRDKIGDKVGDWLLEGLLWLVGIGITWLGVRHWLADEWACINRPWCEVRGWSLGVLIIIAIATTVAVIVFGRSCYRIRRALREMTAQPKAMQKPQFRDIEVEDKRLNLRWVIRRPPHEWLL